MPIAKELIEKIKNNQIEALEITETYKNLSVGKNDINSLGKALKINQSIKTLFIKISFDFSYYYAADSIKLEQNLIEMLSKHLAKNNAITRLKLEAFYLDDASTIALAKGLCSNTSLRELILPSCSGKKGLIVLIETIAQHKSLEFVDLHEIKIHLAETAITLKETVKKNPLLLDVHLPTSDIANIQTIIDETDHILHKRQKKYVSQSQALDILVYSAFKRRAEKYQTKNKWHKAISCYKFVLKFEPNFINDFCYIVAIIQNQHLNEHENALANFSQFLTITPQQDKRYAEVCYKRALLFKLLTKNKKALKDLDQVTKLNSPYQAIAYYQKALIYQKYKNAKETLNNFVMVIQLKSGLYGYNYKEILREAYCACIITYDYLNTDSAKTLEYYTGFLKIAAETDPYFAEIQYRRACLNEALGKYDDAIKDFEASIQLKYQTKEAYYKCACIKHNIQKSPAKALPDYYSFLNEAPENDTRHADIYFTCAKLEKAAHHYDAALKCYTQAIDAYEKESSTYNLVEAYFHRGWIYFDRKSYSQAISAFDTALKLDPHYADIYYFRALAFSETAQTGKTMQDFDSFLAKETSTDTNTVSKKKTAYIKASQLKFNEYYYDDAIKYATALLELEPNNIEVLAIRSAAYDRQGKYHLALPDCEHGIQLAPEDAVFLCNCGVARNGLGDYDKAIEDLQKVITLSPSLANAYNHLGFSYFKKGRRYYKQALENIEKAIDLNSNYADAYLNHAYINKEQEQITNAINDFKDFLRTAHSNHPKRADINFELQSIYYDKQDHREALKYIEEYLQLKPNNGQGIIQRGCIKHRLGNFQAAIVDYELCLKLGDSVSECYNNIAAAKNELGMYEEAIDYASKAIERRTFANPYNHRGFAYTMLQQFEYGIKDFEKAIQLNSGHYPEAKLRLDAAKIALSQQQQSSANSIPKPLSSSTFFKNIPPTMSSKKTKNWHIDPTTKVTLNNDDHIDYQLVPATEQDIQQILQYYEHHPVPGMDIKQIQTIYNPAMNRGFSLRMQLLQGRDKNPAFNPKWPNKSEPSEQKNQRKKTDMLAKELAKDHTDSDYSAVKLLPLWHGTKKAILPSLLKTGYANLATTDSGFFGKGIYSAQEAEYAYQVYGKDGILIMNWISFFSAYPTIKGDMLELSGKANYQNYDAHFVPVVPASNNPYESNYYPCAPEQAHKYIEVVVFESTQCLPRYLVELQPQLLQIIPIPTNHAQAPKKKTTTSTVEPPNNDLTPALSTSETSISKFKMY